MIGKHFFFDDEVQRFYVYSARYVKTDKMLFVKVYPFPSCNDEYNSLCDYIHNKWHDTVYKRHGEAVGYTIDIEEDGRSKENFATLMSALRTRHVSDGQIGAIKNLESLTNDEFRKWWDSMKKD